MKLIGLRDKSIQYVMFRLKDKVTLSFPKDLISTEILICQNIDAFKKYAFEINKKQIEYKVVIFLDYIKILECIRGIQILNELPDSFIDYVKNKCTYKIPHLKVIEDTVVRDKIQESEVGTFFTKIVYPLIYNGVKVKEKKKAITHSIALTILKSLQKNTVPDILRYKADLKSRYLKAFLEWLETNDAKRVAECLLTKTLKYDYDSFEINYLINSLDEED